tara:strand:- start:451 stop:2106 length:1656 start_codon:yes stop_codon:yes gene_type:complete
MKNFDYIVIGSGSSGSALAHRLLEDGKYTVLVLEGGGSDISPLIRMPAALSYPMNMSKYDWSYYSEPEQFLNGRKLKCPRGKVLGGSSSINGMVYVRGNPCDYEYWEDSGAKDWGYSNVLPYFKRMETSHGGEDQWRGLNGPLHITRGKGKNPLNQALLNSASEAGYDVTVDYNGKKQEGFAVGEMTVWKGNRWSSYRAYLEPNLKNKNLTIFKRVLVDHIIFSNNIAIGVAYYLNGKKHEIFANKEIVCSAGSIGSPQILQRSGIGKAEHLKKLGIDIIANRPGVGQNLQDHLEVYFQLKCKKKITLYSHLNLISKASIGLQWLLFRNGLGSTNHFETVGFIRSRAGVKYPDIQYHLLPLAMNYDGTSPFKGHGFQFHVGPMRSNSRGHIKIKSKDPNEHPEIVFNYMSKDQDWIDFRNCIRLSREILNQPSFSDYIEEEIQPGININSDSDIDEFIRNNAESAYHPCGTLKMGDSSDPSAVVNSDCEVIGVKNLRVADSSIFPRITNGNLNGPCIMVGEKAADHILGKPLLPKSNQIPYYSKDWENSQR